MAEVEHCASPILTEAAKKAAISRLQTRYSDLNSFPKLSRTKEANLYLMMGNQDLEDGEYVDAIVHSLRALNSSRSKRATQQAAEILFNAELNRLTDLTGVNSDFIIRQARVNAKSYFDQASPRISHNKREDGRIYIEDAIPLFMSDRNKKEMDIKHELFTVFDNGARSLLDANSQRIVRTSDNIDAIPSEYRVDFIHDRNEDRIIVSCHPPVVLYPKPFMSDIESASILLRRSNSHVSIETGSVETIVYEDGKFPSYMINGVKSVLGIIEAAVKQPVEIGIDNSGEMHDKLVHLQRTYLRSMEISEDGNYSI